MVSRVAAWGLGRGVFFLRGGPAPGCASRSPEWQPEGGPVPAAPVPPLQARHATADRAHVAHKWTRAAVLQHLSILEASYERWLTKADVHSSCHVGRRGRTFPPASAAATLNFTELLLSCCLHLGASRCRILVVQFHYVALFIIMQSFILTVRCKPLSGDTRHHPPQIPCHCDCSPRRE